MLQLLQCSQHSAAAGLTEFFVGVFKGPGAALGQAVCRDTISFQDESWGRGSLEVSHTVPHSYLTESYDSYDSIVRTCTLLSELKERTELLLSCPRQGLALLAWAFAPDSRMRMDPAAGLRMSEPSLREFCIAFQTGKSEALPRERPLNLMLRRRWKGSVSNNETD